jgi:amidohydrolase
MKELNFFDINCTIGYSRQAYSFSEYNKAAIKKELQRCNITKAVCHHMTAREYNALEGNRILNDEIKEDPFFLPAYVMVPNHAGDFLSIDKLEKELKTHKVHLVKMFPADWEHRFSLENWNMEEEFQFLSETRIPLMLSCRQVNMDTLYRIMTDYPRLELIVTDTRASFDKELMRLMELRGSLYLETGTYATLDGIEYITKRFGAERLVFGSGAPFVSAGAAVAKILYARISDEEKEKIAHGNLEKWIGRQSV